MPPESELERACSVADARLGVADSVGWPGAGFAGIAAYLAWDSWLVAFAIGIAAYVLATHKYKKEHAAAWDAYERATQTGKYFKPHNDRSGV